MSQPIDNSFMATKSDHRPRVAAQRRQVTRAHLIESALVLAARHSPTQPSIEQVLDESGVSRGTFYKYFDSVSDLMGALAVEVAHELAGVLDPLVEQLPDPATRLASGMRLCLRMAQHHKALGGLMVQSGWPKVEKSHVFFAVLRRDIEAGMREGRFSKVQIAVALNLVAGSIVGGVQAVLEGASKSYPDQAALCVLLGLGVDADEAQQIVTLRLPEPRIPADGVVARMLGAEEPDRRT